MCAFTKLVMGGFVQAVKFLAKPQHRHNNGTSNNYSNSNGSSFNNRCQPLYLINPGSEGIFGCGRNFRMVGHHYRATHISLERSCATNFKRGWSGFGDKKETFSLKPGWQKRKKERRGGGGWRLWEVIELLNQLLNQFCQYFDEVPWIFLKWHWSLSR